MIPVSTRIAPRSCRRWHGRRNRTPGHRLSVFSAECTAVGGKGIGALLDAEGKLTGDFDGNEKPEVTVWYVPSAYRLSWADSDRCGSKPR